MYNFFLTLLLYTIGSRIKGIIIPTFILIYFKINNNIINIFINPDIKYF